MQKLSVLTFAELEWFYTTASPCMKCVVYLLPLLVRSFPTAGEDKEASHGEVCEQGMLGGMFMQTCAHTRQTRSFAIFLPTGLLVMRILCLLFHIIQPGVIKKHVWLALGCRFTLAAKGSPTVYMWKAVLFINQYMFLSPVCYHLEGGCGLFSLC